MDGIGGTVRNVILRKFISGQIGGNILDLNFLRL